MQVKGRWTYLYRAVDSRGHTTDFLLSTKRDAAAAKRFFRKALGQPYTVRNPPTITVDNNPAYPCSRRYEGRWRSVAAITAAPGESLLEQHCRAGPSADQTPGPPWTWLRESSLTARRTLAGYEAMAMIRKRQIGRISGGDIEALPLSSPSCSRPLRDWKWPTRSCRYSAIAPDVVTEPRFPPDAPCNLPACIGGSTAA